MADSKFDLENPSSRLWVRSKFNVTKWVQLPIDSHPFHSMSTGPPIPGIWLFKIWLWTSKVKVIAQYHKMDPTSYQLTSLGITGPKTISPPSYQGWLNNAACNGPDSLHLPWDPYNCSLWVPQHLRWIIPNFFSATESTSVHKWLGGLPKPFMLRHPV